MFVRPAKDGDQNFIAKTQKNAMIRLVRDVHEGGATEETENAFNETQMADSWGHAIGEGMGGGHGVFIAEDQGVPVGFAAFYADRDSPGIEAGEVGPIAVAPGSAQILAFEVLPTHVNKGHGSRLLAAVADAARAARVNGLAAWIVADDAPRVQFFQKAGLAPVGLRRSLETPSGNLVEHLWYADL